MHNQLSDLTIEWNSNGNIALTFYQWDMDQPVKAKFLLSEQGTDEVVGSMCELLAGFRQSQRTRTSFPGGSNDSVHYLNVGPSIAARIGELMVEGIMGFSRERDWDWFEDEAGFRKHTEELHVQKNAGNLFLMCAWLEEKDPALVKQEEQFAKLSPEDQATIDGLAELDKTYGPDFEREARDKSEDEEFEKQRV